MLNSKTLVLNSQWTPINVTSLRHAMCLLYRRVADVVCPVTYQRYSFDSWADMSVEPDEPCVRTVSISVKVPEVIVLLSGNAFPKHRVPFSRRNLFNRDRFTCQFCGKQPGSRELTIDHLVAKARGGKTEWTNCVLACIDCNSRKGSKPLPQSGLRLRRKPLVPKWSPFVSIAVTERRESWRSFVSDAYWDTELDPD
jgi:5-methylcytosine-specific restriction endonuclease McrA